MLQLLAHALLVPAGIVLVPEVRNAPWLIAGLLLPALTVRVLVASALRFDAQTDLLASDLLAWMSAEYPELPARLLDRSWLVWQKPLILWWSARRGRY